MFDAEVITRKQSAGRPIEDTPILNAVGLMRHLIGSEAGANLRVDDEIERLTGRTVLDSTPSASARRVSEFILGRRPIPDWVDYASRRWCVATLTEAMKRRKVQISLEYVPGRRCAAAEVELLAEGLVASLLAAVVDHNQKRFSATLGIVDAIMR